MVNYDYLRGPGLSDEEWRWLLRAVDNAPMAAWQKMKKALSSDILSALEDEAPEWCRDDDLPFYALVAAEAARKHVLMATLIAYHDGRDDGRGDLAREALGLLGVNDLKE